MFFEPRCILKMDCIETRNMAGERRLIGRHPVIVLSIVDDYFYCLRMSTSFFEDDGSFLSVEKQLGFKKGCFINLNCIHKISIKNYKPEKIISEDLFLYIISKLINQQENSNYQDPNYIEIRDELYSILHREDTIEKTKMLSKF